MEQWLNLIRNFNFPIVITFYLLLRFEKKIATIIEKEQDK
ncbi:YvrJ family protein [Priestia megaterium]